MADKCTNCGRTASQTIADAKTLGLFEELQSGVYKCCQISEWADEQWLAWFQAIEEDSGRVEDNMLCTKFTERGLVLVPVRFNRPQVPWYRGAEDLR
ncbi:MAG TPA: hypothetical protein VH351_10145 [Bryobacteraceae bacterium]|jgi:hypothetical protein|nr:hypothetical protein [Bryobacteraceae bacterium]